MPIVDTSAAENCVASSFDAVGAAFANFSKILDFETAGITIKAVDKPCS